MRHRGWLLIALLSGAAVLTKPHAAEMPDDGLLEFLGSVDSEDKDWHDYLARTDIDKVARRAGRAPGAAGVAVPPAATPPAGQPDGPARSVPPAPPTSSAPPANTKPVTPP